MEKESREEEVVSLVADRVAHHEGFQSLLADLAATHPGSAPSLPAAPAKTLVWTFDSDDSGSRGQETLSSSGSRSTFEEVEEEDRSRMLEEFGGDSELVHLCLQLAPSSGEGDDAQRASLQALLGLPPDEVVSDGNFKALIPLLAAVLPNGRLRDEARALFSRLLAASLGGVHTADLLCGAMGGTRESMRAVEVCVCGGIQERALYDLVKSFSLLSSFFDGAASTWNTLSEREVNDIFQSLCSLYNIEMKVCGTCLGGTCAGMNESFPCMFLFVLADSSLSWMEALLSKSSARSAFLLQALKASTLSKFANFLSPAGELFRSVEEKRRGNALCGFDLLAITTYHNVKALALLTRHEEICCLCNREQLRVDWIELHDSSASPLEQLPAFSLDACKLFSCVLTSRAQNPFLLHFRRDLLSLLGEIVGSSTRCFYGVEPKGHAASVDEIETNFVQAALTICKTLKGLLESTDATNLSKETCEQVVCVAEACHHVVHNTEKDFPHLLFYSFLARQEGGEKADPLNGWMKEKLAAPSWYVALGGLSSFQELLLEMNHLVCAAAKKTMEISRTGEIERMAHLLAWFLPSGQSRCPCLSHLPPLNQTLSWTDSMPTA
eukprot:747580-Hanusia_phi.AAC.1